VHLAVLVTNTDESAFAACHPRDGAKFRALFAAVRPDWRVSVFDLTRGEMPSGDFDGWVIGGSPASVNEVAEWIARLMGLIRDTDLPIFGACFGHQAIAKALGGEVAPQGWIFGAVPCEVATPWGQGRFRLAAAHHEQVTRLPEGAEVVASHPGCPIGGFRIGTRIFTTQNHPEIDDAFLAALVAEYEPKLPEGTVKPLVPVEGPAFAEVIARFFEAYDSAASRSIAVT
jgi:GMP synthase-like glutamine amidotransferase